MFLVRLAFKNPYAIIVMAIAIAVLGLTSIAKISTDLLPQFKSPAAEVITLYPGMAAQTVEKDITTRLERWTGQSVGIKTQESKSLVGTSIIYLFFHEDTDQNSALTQASSYATSDLYYLPPGTLPPIVIPYDPTATIPTCILSVKSDIYGEKSLYDMSYFLIRSMLQGISGVIAPTVYGGKLRQIQSYVDKDKLQARKMSPLDVVNALNKQNLFIPTGDMRLGKYDYLLESNAMVSKVSQMNDFPIEFKGKRPVLMKDVGEVEDSAVLQQSIVRVDGKRQVYLPVYRQPGGNTIEIVDGVRKAIPDMTRRLPQGLKMEVDFDQSNFIRQAINNLIQEGLIGTLMAVIMILVFLRNIKATFFILLSLPLSILAATVGLYFTDNSLNAMTLGGFAVAVGLLIDQAVVVLENTERHLSMGKEPTKAAVDAAIEVANPVLVIVICVCVVFFPITFMTGIGKFLFTSLALSVILSMMASYVISLTVVPLLCAKFLKPTVHHEGHQEHGVSRWLWKSFEKLRSGYTSTLDKVLNVRWAILSVVGVLFIGSLLLIKVIGTELYPKVNAGQFMVRVIANSGTQIYDTEKTCARVEDTIQGVIGKDKIKKMITNIGVLNTLAAAYVPNAGPFDGFILVQLNTNKKVKEDQEYIHELRDVLTQKFPGVEFVFSPNSILRSAISSGLQAPINIQVQGEDLHTSHKIAEELEKKIRDIPGTADVHIEQRLDYPQYNIEIDRYKAAEMGISPDEIVKNVVSAFNSSANFKKEFWIDEWIGNNYWVGVQYPEKDFKNIDTLLNVPITSASQHRPALLRNLVKLTKTTVPSEVMHYDIARVIDIYCDVEGRDLGSVSAEIDQKIKEMEDEGKVPLGYSIHSRGEVKGMKESFGNLGFGLVLAVILLYLVIVVQFRSLLDPLIIMMAVPLGLIGVLWMLFITGTYLSIPALMGIIMMVGIVVSFSLLMIDFANTRRREGLSPLDAIREAAAIRLRPILMTALATLLGLVPMAIEGGANIPLARAVIGGVFVAMLLTLYIVPIFYILLRRKRTID